MTTNVFIVDWFSSFAGTPNEVHALAVQLDEATGLYNKCLIRVDFPDFAYILFPEDPEPALIDRARKALEKKVSMRFMKVKTIAGYQAEPSVPALVLRSADLAEVFRHPSIKALGGYVEEHTAISRSRKLTAFRNMGQCCWISLSGSQVIGDDDPARITKPGIAEYRIADWEKLEALPLESRAAFTPPPSSSVKVLSFDIEVFKPSNRGGGMPDASERPNFVMCISSVVHQKSTLEGGAPSSQGGRKETTLHTIFDVVGGLRLSPPGTRIVRYATEYEMIRGFWDQVALDDPLLILGFNVQSWDFRYLDARMKLHGITYPSALSIYARPPDRMTMRKAQWSSDAFKNNDMLWPDIPGMVVLDLHKFYTRSRPSLRKFSLDFISRYYLGGRGKHPMSQERMVAAYETGNPDELRAVADYNVEDSMLVLDLFLSQQIFDEAALEALTSETLLDDLYTKGMQVRALNKLYRYAKEDGYVVTTSPGLSISRGQGGGGSQLVGALVQGSEPGRYDDVAVYDIRSMYPTLLMSRNICYTTFVDEDSRSKVEHNTYKWETKSGDPDSPHDIHEASFVTVGVKQGLCTRLLSDQLQLRNQLRTWRSEEGNSSKILDYAQRGVKLVSNSIIGLMGAASETSRLSFPAAAGVVYTAARSSITTIIQDVSTWEGAPHGRVVYSDTDSVLVAGMPDSSGRTALLQHLNGQYAPFIFELESVGRLLLVGPKNYIMRLNDDGSLIYRGVDFSRRSSSDFVSQSMRDVTEMIMEKTHSRLEILEYIKKRSEEIREEPLDAFAMSATVSMAVQSVGGKLGRRLISQGAILLPGDVIDYIVLTKPVVTQCGKNEVFETRTTKKAPKVIGVTDRTATVEEVQKCPENKVDYDYYIDKLRGSADRLLVF